MPTKPDAHLQLMCPNCGGMNKPGAKPTLEIENGTVTCVSCGSNFPRPARRKDDDVRS